MIHFIGFSWESSIFLNGTVRRNERQNCGNPGYEGRVFFSEPEAIEIPLAFLFFLIYKTCWKEKI